MRIGKVEKIILHLLKETPGLSSREVADKLHYHETYVSKIMENMERKCLIDGNNVVISRYASALIELEKKIYG